MLPYQDKNLPVEDRISDLISRMTLKEKIRQTDQYFCMDFITCDENGFADSLDMEKVDKALNGLSCGSIQIRGMSAEQANEVQSYAVEKTRLGIPFLLSEEALHGVHRGDATSFPQQLGLAATFRPELGYKMGRAIATEARAMGIHETYSPVMDLARDPRYGRTEETYGEDTYLGGEFARETVKGMQGKNLSDPDAIAAEPKHYVGYGNPVGGLNCAPSTMGRHDVFSDCLPIFEEAIKEGGAMDAMCSYNSIDSIPVSMDHELLTDVLRGQFGMRGFVRTDLTAVSRLWGSHFITPTEEEAVRMGLEAGCDLQLYDFTHEVWCGSIEHLITSGKMKEEVLDTAVRRILRTKFLLGLFEQPYVTDTSLQHTVVRSKEHLSVAREIAQNSIVLLKNSGILPLKKDIGTIAVLGPLANKAALGDYSVNAGRSGTVTVLDGIKKAVSENTKVLYAAGCNILGDELHAFDPSMLRTETGDYGLTARYYNGRELKGEPVMTRVDHTINFNWIYSVPHPTLDPYCFSVVWTGSILMNAPFKGCIGFSTADSMRLYIDDKLLIDGWGDDKDAGQVLDVEFEAGRKYAVRVEFTNDQRGARVIFGYNRGREDYTAAVEYARKADVAVVCLGDNEETSGENFDRSTLDLPGKQLDFLKKIVETGTPVVLLMQTGRPVSCVWEQNNCSAILEAWFPGEQGGYAAADVLFGDFNPGGRLPMTFPHTVGQIPCHYSRRPGGGTRYVEMTWMPLFPFGYGLSYTTFRYTNLKLDKTVIAPGETVKASFTVTNTGNRKGTCVPQLYLRDFFSSVVKPLHTLCAFERIELEAGESKTVTLAIGPKAMRTLGVDYVWRVEQGDFEVQLCDNAEEIFDTAKFTVE